MKNVFNLFAICLVALSLNSCTSTRQGYQSSPVISKHVELDPIKADIIVNEEDKISGSSSSSYFLFFRVKGDNTFADGISYSTDASSSVLSSLNPLSILQASRLGPVRGSAAYDALKNTDYDVLVHPTYTITVNNYLIFKKYQVSVEGYGARYANFRTEKKQYIITDDNKEYIFTE